MERRAKTRFYDRGSVICSPFNGVKHFEGQLLNFSPRGMSFQTRRAFKPGTTVQIRLENCPGSNAAHLEKGGIRSMTLAMILWCRHDNDPHVHSFTSGVLYL